MPQGSRPVVLLFDVNETLLDLAPLEESIDEVLLENGASRLWFTTLLQYSLVLTVGGKYESFVDVGAATLMMLARNREVVLSPEQARQALEPMLKLAPHHDVLDALARLKRAGFRMASLSNSSIDACKSQLEHAGLASMFERQLSVESVAKYKPHCEVYQWAAREMKVSEQDCMLVAAHAWDVAGAAWAGMQTAFIERKGNQPFSLALPPSVCASDLHNLADQLAA
ncbi:haloacid dehalogenase type II [Massilia psychrophila]|uniref:(S)-2-haloacid dehalogenase n=2 Tax=Massilia psychrophila TaxID=1603353 RepID=A0A2G8SWN2_9BURK|nr:haloacid dehalogenase type II [Massilia psychrophila]